MKLGVPRETFPGERRVAIVPGTIGSFLKLGIEVVVEAGAGAQAGFTDAAYLDQKATIGSRADVFQCDIVAQVRTPGANPAHQDAGGYAKAQDESFYQRQRELLHKVVAGSDVVITTAAIPGKRSPVLVTASMVEAMAPGSVIVDLAAERGGNCELTKADEVVVHHGVTIMGPTDLASTVPYHSSQMYSRNVQTLIQHLVPREQGPDGKPTGAARLVIDMDDEITKEILVTAGGHVVHPRVQQPQGAV